MTYPDEIHMNRQVPTGDRHMKAIVKCVNNLAIQKLRTLDNWIFHGVYDFVCGAVRQSTALGYQKKIKKLQSG